MKIYKEISLKDFEFWSGARDFREKLTDEEMDTVESIMVEDGFTHYWSETMINDFFWFDQDTVAEWLDTTEEEIWARE